MAGECFATIVSTALKTYEVLLTWTLDFLDDLFCQNLSLGMHFICPDGKHEGSAQEIKTGQKNTKQRVVLKAL